MSEKFYTKTFHQKHTSHAYKFEEELAKQIINYFNIQSVLDIGCGIGRWLKGIMDIGITDILGLEYAYDDAKDYIYDNVKDNVKFGDATKPINLERTFDCVWSFEVAEHLPKEFAEQFVENVVNNTDRFIILTAAPPGQGGLDHINEQPKEYWIDLFTKYSDIVYREDLVDDLKKYYKLIGPTPIV